MSSKKVIVVGLDGATWDLILPWINKGLLPTFKQLMKKGTWGYLESTVPPVTSPAWPSFFTGVNAGKHGVFGFLNVHETDLNKKHILTRKDVKTKSLWQILSEKNLCSIVVNVPVTFPPEKIKGVLIAGLLSNPNKIFTYPPRLTQFLKEKKYKIDLNFYFDKNIEKNIYPKILSEIETKRFEIWLELMRRNKWHFSMVVLANPDRIQHSFWNKKELILKQYKIIDKMLEELERYIAKNTYLILMSDHGFGPIHTYVYINNLLERWGFLKIRTLKKEIDDEKSWVKLKYIKQRNNFLKKIFIFFGFSRRSLEDLKRRKIINILIKIIPKLWRKKLSQVLPVSIRSIDWSQTKAYFTTLEMQGININLKNREPYGRVPKKDYDNIRNEIIKYLKNLKDPKTNKPVIKRIYKREEIYHGPEIEKAPDIIYTPQEGYLGVPKLKRSIIFERLDPPDAFHYPYGIFLIKGPNIKPGYQIKKAHILDLAPTILDLFQIKLPSYFDGKILKDIYEKK